MMTVEEKVALALNARGGPLKWTVRRGKLICCRVDGRTFFAVREWGGKWWTRHCANISLGRCEDMRGVDLLTYRGDDPKLIADAVWSSLEAWRAGVRHEARVQ